MTRQRVHARHDDSEVASPDGRLCLRSEHGVSAGLWRHRAALTMRVGERVVWSRGEGLRVGSPQSMWVDNSGYAAVLYGDDTLVLADPAGEVVATVAVLEQLMSDTRARELVSRTTAGYFWDRDPIGAFARCNEMVLFSLRTYWGTRIVLRGDGEAEIRTDWLSAIRDAEVSAAMAVLGEFVNHPPPAPDLSNPYPRPPGAPLQAACLLGLEGVSEAVPGLRRACQVVAFTHASSSLGGVRLANGKFGRLGYRLYGVRLIVNHALIRLGRAPTAEATYGLAWTRADYVDRDRPGDVWERVVEVRAKMSHAEVWELCGAPTYLSLMDGRWWYDGVEESVRLHFARGRVSQINRERDRPWLGSFARERSLLG